MFSTQIKAWFVSLGILVFLAATSCQGQNEKREAMQQQDTSITGVKLFLCGDVMTGRGVDQALPHSVDPVLYESYIKDARDYLRLAERKSGNIKTPVSYDYIWGEAMEVWEENAPDFKLINLETSITTHSGPWPEKGINYRMHPKNVQVLVEARIDHCSLGNNHTLDWSRPGLLETIQTLQEAGIQYSGAGKNEAEARLPSILTADSSRILVFSYGSRSSGIPPEWEAEAGLAGLNYLAGLDGQAIEEVKKQVELIKKTGDIAVFSIHWGGNWGYDISSRQQAFAHKLIDEADVDVVYGHSSHHPMGLEIYHEKLIIYGAGDFINDYEGISGKEQYRGELVLMYFPQIDWDTGRLLSLKMVPMRVKKFQLHRANTEETNWLQAMLQREGEKLGTGVSIEKGELWLKW